MAGLVPQQRAEPGCGQAEQQAHQHEEQRPRAEWPGEARAAGGGQAVPQPVAEAGRDRHRQRRQPLRGGPGARQARSARAQPAAVADRVPGPAGERAQRETEADEVVVAAGCAGLRCAVAVHDQQAAQDQREGRRQAQPGRAVLAAAAMAVEQVCAHGDHHRQRADDQRRHRRAGELDRARQGGVIEEVADQGELGGLDPVGAFQLRQRLAVEPRQPERQHAKGEVATDGEHEARVVVQHQRRQEHQPPEQAGAERGGEAGEHGAQSVLPK